MSSKSSLSNSSSTQVVISSFSDTEASILNISSFSSSVNSSGK
jgi:hypothetical protein